MFAYKIIFRSHGICTFLLLLCTYALMHMCKIINKQANELKGRNKTLSLSNKNKNYAVTCTSTRVHADGSPSLWYRCHVSMLSIYKAVNITQLQLTYCSTGIPPAKVRTKTRSPATVAFSRVRVRLSWTRTTFAFMSERSSMRRGYTNMSARAVAHTRKAML